VVLHQEYEPPLAVHSDARSVINYHWEKMPLSEKDLQKIELLLGRINVLKQQGLFGFRIVASYLRRRVQPLKTRENYVFEYVGAEDPFRMVPMVELTEEEVLECLHKILKGVSVVPHRVDEYFASIPPPTMSCPSF